MHYKNRKYNNNNGNKGNGEKGRVSNRRKKWLEKQMYTDKEKLFK